MDLARKALEFGHPLLFKVELAEGLFPRTEVEGDALGHSRPLLGVYELHWVIRTVQGSLNWLLATRLVSRCLPW